MVYKGYDPERGVVLLKVLTPEAAEDPALVAWMEQEAAAVAAVEHPNVVALYASGREDGRPYLVAEFVEGLSLDAALLAHGSLPPELAAYVAAETARGLGAAHAAGVLHRDLKPANVLLGYDGQVKLTDFGLATRIDAAGAAEVRGTPGYLAPEAVRGEASGPPADLFALGATLAEMLTGRPAFPAPTASAALNAALHHDPLPPLRADPRFPAGLIDVAQALLGKDPSTRPAAVRGADDLDTYRTITGTGFRAGAGALAAFLADADAYRASRPVTPSVLLPPVAEPTPRVAPDAVPMPPAPLPSRRRRGVWAGATMLVLLVTAVLVVVAVRSAREISDNPAEDARLDATDSLRQDSTAGALPVSDSLLAEAVPDEPEEEAPVEETPVGEEPVEVEPVGEETEPEPDSASPLPLPEVAEEPPVRTPPASPAAGTLIVAVQPWARVLVDGREIGEGSLVDVGALSAGTHRIVLRNPDFPEYSTTVTVAPGEAERLPVSLWTLVENLTILAHPYAEVVIDGRPYGTVYGTASPQRQAILLRPGSHTLHLRHPILGTYATTVSAQAGRARTLSFNLLQLLDGENAP